MQIIEFKTRQQLFEKWLELVIENNFEDKSIKIPSALFCWETQDKDESIANHARFNCDLENLKWFHRMIGEKIKEMEFDEFMRKHINEYIEYIN